ncbi:hypothetical protein OOT46_02575 [Aquabacterium sp. A7-Y]|nr:hypothetical protein [Aquabacterium sp. A7-Y]MCW7536739.1 hypothetical protein [Aquabacterium sp. A7-Y]
MRGKHFIVSGIELVRVGTQAFSYRQSWLRYVLSESVTLPPPSGQR